MNRNIISEFKDKILVKGSFVQNLGWSMSGNVVIILTQLVFSPILTRLYGPEAYGSFALFNAIAFNISSIASLQYDKALILPKEKTVFNALARLCFLSAGSVFIIFFLLVIFFPILFLSMGLPNKPIFLYGLPFLIGVLSIIQIANNWILRKSYFKEVMVYGVPVTIGTRLVNLGYGLLTKGSIEGIVLGELVGKSATAFINYRKILKKDFLEFFKNSQSWGSIKNAAYQFRKFPLFDMPANWFGIVSSQLPIYFLGGYAGIGFLGYFGLATSLLDMPVRILGYSMSNVFTVKAAELVNKKEIKKIGETIQKLYWSLFCIAFPPFLILILIGPSLFGWAFGKNWEMAGQLCSVLAMFVLSRLVVDPFLGLYRVLQKQHRLLIFQIINFVLQAFLFFLLQMFKISPFHIVGWFAFASGVLYVIQIIDIGIISNISNKKLIGMSLALLVIQILTLYQLS